MWPSNSKNINNLSTRAIPIEQIKNNINEPAPIYQTPIKQSLNVQGNNDTPLQFDFNFFFGNLWSSGHIPNQNMEIPLNNSVAQPNREANILLFKSSLEKSGYKLTPASEIKNSNIIDYGIPNNINIYENELNQNEFTKKNLTELFNNAKNDEFLQSNKKVNTIPNNVVENNSNIYYYNNLSNNGNNIIIPNNYNNQNMNCDRVKNNIQNNMDYDEEDDKENKNNFNNDPNILNRNYDNKIIMHNNYNISNSIINDKNDKIIFNDKGEEIFNSPINKKPKKIFECSGSTLGTNSSKSSTRKRRFRKNNEQLIMLSQFFNEHKHWSKNQIKEISQRTGLKENKVYKWLWDQRNKEYKATKFIINKKNLP